MAYSPSEHTRDRVRERPGMYIGSTGSLGPLTMALEVIENAVDLILSGRATSIGVQCHSDNSIEIRDDGPGLDLSDPGIRSFFEVGHDSATADGHTPHIHLLEGGLGLFVVNALSERLRVESTQAGVRSVHEWTDGGDSHREVEVEDRHGEPSGTSIRFWPDRTIFGDSQVLLGKLVHRLDELEQLLPELAHLEFTSSRSTGSEGLLSLMNSRLGRVEDPWRLSTISPGASDSSTAVEIAMSATFRYQHLHERMLLFCNFREVTEVSGMHRAIRQALGAAEDLPLGGLNVVCSLRMLAPEFSGPTKGKVNDPRAVAAVRDAVEQLLAENPDAHAAITQLVAAQSAN